MEKREKFLEIDFSNLDDGVYFICPKCFEISDHLIEEGDVSYMGKVRFELSKSKLIRWGKTEIDLSDLGELRPFSVRCPNCYEEFILDEVDPEDYMIAVEDGKLAYVGDYWKKFFDL